MTTATMATPAIRKVVRTRNVSDRDFISVRDFSPEEIDSTLETALVMKEHPADFRGALAGKQVVLFFEKPSLRTRVTFESAMASLGGVSFFHDQSAARLGTREPISDMAMNLERWVDGVILRTFAHQTSVDMAKYGSIPVINALSDYEHPCQAMADVLTVKENFEELTQVTIAYVGDGNNVAHSLMLAAASVGSNISVGTPAGYEPKPEIIAAAQKLADQSGCKVSVCNDPVAAVRNADVVYTDVWASMGKEAEAADRKRIFAPFQVNNKLMSHAAPHAVFMHCLPAHRGEEVAAEVIDSERSIVYDQAENRLHIQKAILVKLLGGASTVSRQGA